MEIVPGKNWFENNDRVKEIKMSDPMISNGKCPECELNDKSVSMRINQDDFFECPQCNIHILNALSLKAAGILSKRGNNQFNTTVTESDNCLDGHTLCKATLNKGFWGPCKEFFYSKDDLITYIKMHVS